ncbi:MAG: DUF3859 domain-containing protein [Rhodospirillaceae bacterium]|nr:DUF3859 domain-containing protein [Rhodospirillaceae bacterium]
MRKASAAAFLSALVVVVGFGAAASAEPRANIVAYGRYEIVEAGRPEKAERTVAGEVRPVETRRLVQKTDEIVGQLGNTFGVEIDLSGLPPGPIKLVIRTLHPKLTNSETGKTMTVSEYDWTVTARERVYFGFTFDYRWEIAEGIWTKQIIYNGKILAEKRFKIIVPMN